MPSNNNNTGSITRKFLSMMKSKPKISKQYFRLYLFNLCLTDKNAIRERWKGKLVIKGIASEEDTEMAIRLGLDGIIVSNHGGRQLDPGQSSIKSLHPIVEKYSNQIKIMMDSGLRSGPDIARTLASGADFAFLGRSFMYAVAALGQEGGDHMISSLKVQLKQVMDQICSPDVSALKNHLIK